MPKSKYSKLVKEKLSLRDNLAIDRTILANERTFLAYVRTALTLFVAGVSLIQFFKYFIHKKYSVFFISFY